MKLRIIMKLRIMMKIFSPKEALQCRDGTLNREEPVNEQDIIRLY